MHLEEGPYPTRAQVEEHLPSLMTPPPPRLRRLQSLLLRQAVPWPSPLALAREALAGEALVAATELSAAESVSPQGHMEFSAANLASVLQTGQVQAFCSQGRTQCPWKRCMHGSLTSSSPS